MAHFLAVLAALLIANLPALVVHPLFRQATHKPPPPRGVDAELWKQIVDRTSAGWLIGLLERNLALAALWIGKETLIAGWFAFKLASKWEVFRDIVKVPESVDGLTTLEWFGARSQLGSWLLARFWIGTLTNLLLGLIGALVGLSLVGPLRYWLN